MNLYRWLIKKNSKALNFLKLDDSMLDKHLDDKKLIDYIVDLSIKKLKALNYSIKTYKIVKDQYDETLYNVLIDDNDIDINISKSLTIKDFIIDLLFKTYRLKPTSIRIDDLIGFDPEIALAYGCKDLDQLFNVYWKMYLWCGSSYYFRNNLQDFENMLKVLRSNLQKFDYLYRLTDEFNFKALSDKNINDTITFNLCSTTTKNLLDKKEDVGHYVPSGFQQYKMILVFENCLGLDLSNYYKFQNHFKHEKEVITFGKFKIIDRSHKIIDKNYYQIIRLKTLDQNMSKSSNLIKTLSKMIKENTIDANKGEFKKDLITIDYSMNNIKQIDFSELTKKLRRINFNLTKITI